AVSELWLLDPVPGPGRARRSTVPASFGLPGRLGGDGAGGGAGGCRSRPGALSRAGRRRGPSGGGGAGHPARAAARRGRLRRPPRRLIPTTSLGPSRARPPERGGRFLLGGSVLLGLARLDDA